MRKDKLPYRFFFKYVNEFEFNFYYPKKVSKNPYRCEDASLNKGKTIVQKELEVLAGIDSYVLPINSKIILTVPSNNHIPALPSNRVNAGC